jgi:hypothetical protein
MATRLIEAMEARIGLLHPNVAAGRRNQPTGDEVVRKSNFALRLQPSLLDEARKAAQAEGVALNHLINVAVAEKLSALRTEKYFAERAARARRRSPSQTRWHRQSARKGDKVRRARKTSA